MPQPAGTSLLDHFAALEDPRQTAKVLYPLPEILLLLLSATLAGADDLRRDRALGQRAAGLPAPVPALPARDPQSRHAGRGGGRARSCAVQGLLHELGRGPARDGAGPDRHRRQDLPPQPCPQQGTRAAASRLGLGQPPAPGARAGGGERQVERDHRHPAAPGAAGAQGGPGHDRCHRHPDRDRPRPSSAVAATISWP